MTDHVHICTFTVGIDELPRRKQRDPLEVARVLAQHGRFSVFEATANQDIARTMDKLMRNGWFVSDAEASSYPWTHVTLTDAGRAALGMEG